MSAVIHQGGAARSTSGKAMTDKITIERETLQSAVDALDACTTDEGPEQIDLNRARDTLAELRAALKENQT